MMLGYFSTMPSSAWTYVQWNALSSPSDHTSTISKPRTDETRAIELARARIAAVLRYLPDGFDDFELSCDI
jgi:hypothetical protein